MKGLKWSKNQINNLKLETMFTIQIDEVKLAEVVRQAVMDGIGSSAAKGNPKEEREHKILQGMKELQNFLGCSAGTAQKLKNEGLIPYRQVRRKILFDTEEVLKAMEVGGKRKFKKQ